MAGHSTGSQGISSAAFARNIILFSWEAVLHDCFLVYIKLHASPCTLIAIKCSNIIFVFLPKTGTEIHCEFRCFINTFIFEIFTRNYPLTQGTAETVKHYKFKYEFIHEGMTEYLSFIYSSDFAV